MVAAPRISAHIETSQADPICRANLGIAGLERVWCGKAEGKPRIHEKLHAGGSCLWAIGDLSTEIQWGFIDNTYDVAGIRRELI